MAILKTLRTADACPPSGEHPYVDTPDFRYDHWLQWLGGKPIGSVPKIGPRPPRVAVIGGGVSGLCAAYELARAGCLVSVFEQASEVGGRCASHLFATGATDIAEMGSMRFPPTEFILNQYLTSFGILPTTGLCGQPDFPDPGVCNTYVCYGGKVETWKGATPPPPDFAKVAAGWKALVKNGLNADLPGAEVITLALAEDRTTDATKLWQNWLDAFGQHTFYSALYAIFTGASGYPIPGDKAWTFDDFDRFGALGVGSGGFGPLYPIGFMDIFRLIVNELETTQKFLQPSNTLKDGIRTLPFTFQELIREQSPNSNWYLNSPVSAIRREGSIFQVVRDSTEYSADRVIVATTTRAMELTLGLTDYVGKDDQPLVSPEVAEAIMRTHVVSSNKVAARIKNFWANDPNAIRCLQTDNLVHQVYTLDYTKAGAPPAPTGVCFISYVWDDDAVKQQAITSGVPTGPADNKKLYDYLLGRLIAIGGEVAQWAKANLVPDGPYDKNVVFEEWQSMPYFAGAFKLSQPGQDGYVQRMFFDYQKCQDPNKPDTGVYIAGDCISWTSGWVEGALTTGLNAAAGVIKSLGGTVTPDDNGKSPLTIDAGRYRYFGPKPTS